MYFSAQYIVKSYEIFIYLVRTKRITFIQSHCIIYTEHTVIITEINLDELEFRVSEAEH